MSNHADILVLSDLHTNNIGGLITPDDDIHEFRTPAEEDMAKHRLTMWNKFISQVKSYDDQFEMVVFLAELLELPHPRNIQNTIHPKAELDELVDMVANILKELPLVKNAKILGCLGSRFHVTVERRMDVERLCYKKFEEMGFEVELNWEQRPVDFDVYDTRIRAWHKMTGNADKNITGNLIKQATIGERAPDIILTGHYHKSESTQKQYMNKVYDFVRCPCLCLPFGDLGRLVGMNEYNDANYALGFRTLRIDNDNSVTNKLWACEVREQRKVTRLK